MKNMEMSFLKESLAFIESLKEPARIEARQFFPNHPKAQEIWVKLCSSSGGVCDVVETLRLHQEYSAYTHDFNQAVKMGYTETASIQVENFREFCKQKLLEDFYMFK